MSQRLVALANIIEPLASPVIVDTASVGVSRGINRARQQGLLGMRIVPIGYRQCLDSAIGHQAALTSTFSGVFTTRPWETWSLGIGIVCETTWIVGQQASRRLEAPESGHGDGGEVTEQGNVGC